MNKQMQMAEVIASLQPEATCFTLDEAGNLIEWWDSLPRPSDEAIANELAQQDQAQAVTQYARDRQAAYPDLGAQLGLLYDDLKTGNLTNGQWIKTIDAIKAQYPKPSATPSNTNEG